MDGGYDGRMCVVMDDDDELEIPKILTQSVTLQLLLTVTVTMTCLFTCDR